MLRCDQIAAQSSDFLDQNLRWHEVVSFRLHVMMCANCRRFVHQLHLFQQAVQLRGLSEPSQGQIDQWLQSVSATQRIPSSREDQE